VRSKLEECSEAFGWTTEVSPYLVRLGTTEATRSQPTLARNRASMRSWANPKIVF
jgi:hypothetical protein